MCASQSVGGFFIFWRFGEGPSSFELPSNSEWTQPVRKFQDLRERKKKKRFGKQDFKRGLLESAGTRPLRGCPKPCNPFDHGIQGRAGTVRSACRLIRSASPRSTRPSLSPLPKVASPPALACLCAPVSLEPLGQRADIEHSDMKRT